MPLNGLKVLSAQWNRVLAALFVKKVSISQRDLG